MKKLITIIVLTLIIPINANAEGNMLFSMLGDIAESATRSVISGGDVGESIFEAGARSAYYKVDDVIEAGIEKMSSREMDEHDFQNLSRIATRAMAGKTYEWDNPYTRKRYEAVAKPFKVVDGTETRDIVIFPSGSTSNRFTVTAVSDGNGRWAFNF